MYHSGGSRVGASFINTSGIVFDSDSPRSVFARRGDHDTSIAGPEVIEDILASDGGQFEHRIHNLWRACDVGRIDRYLFGQRTLPLCYTDENASKDRHRNESH